jgi:hypothetical protein
MGVQCLEPQYSSIDATFDIFAAPTLVQKDWLASSAIIFL